MLTFTKNEISVFIFSEFMEYLRLRGFLIGVDEYLRLQTLIDRVGLDQGPEDLRDLICPLVATDKIQQEEFHRAFADYFVLTDTADDLQSYEAKAEKSSKGILPVRLRKPVYAAFGLTLVLTVSFFLVFNYLNGPPTPDPTDEFQMLETINTQAAEGVQPPLPPVPDTSSLTLDQAKEIFRSLASAAVIAVFLGYALYLFEKRRRIRRRQADTKPPFSFKIDIKSSAPAIYNSEDFYRAARQLRKRRDEEFERLDIPATIGATIKSLGFPVLCYRPESKAHEYLILIERLSFRDHQALLFDELVFALQDEGLHIARYFFEADPRICRDEQGKYYLLTDLQIKHGFSRLLVFCDGEKFLDPITGKLQDWTAIFEEWTERSLHTPESCFNWGPRERGLAARFAIFPATVEGLIDLTGRYEHPEGAKTDHWRRHTFIPPDLPDVLEGIALSDLRDMLNPGVFDWVCACAVNPDLNWKLTLYLGTLPEFGKNLLSEENLWDLVRLSWFRQGAIPPETRAIMTKELEKDKEKIRAVRRAIIEILDQQQPPRNSFANNAYQLFLAVQRWLLEKTNVELLKNLRLMLRRLPPDEIVRDPTLVPAFRSVPQSRFGHIIPVSIRKIIYRFGIPNLGFRNLFLAAFLLFTISIAWLAMTAIVNAYEDQSREIAWLILPRLLQNTYEDVPTPGSLIPAPLDVNNSNQPVNNSTGAKSNKNSSVNTNDGTADTNVKSPKFPANVKTPTQASPTPGRVSVPPDGVISPDGKRYVTFSEGIVRLFDIETRNLMTRVDLDCCIIKAWFERDGKAVHVETGNSKSGYSEYGFDIETGKVFGVGTGAGSGSSTPVAPVGNIRVLGAPPGASNRDRIQVDIESYPQGATISFARKIDSADLSKYQSAGVTPTSISLPPAIYVFLFTGKDGLSSTREIIVR